MKRFLSLFCVVLAFPLQLAFASPSPSVISETARFDTKREKVELGALLLDQNPKANAAFSLRKLRTDYNGPAIRVRRSLDDAEQDIGFDASGYLDLVALTVFVGLYDGFVTVWYDQTKAGVDLVQDVAQMQPRVIISGAPLLDPLGLPRIRFDRDSAHNLGSAMLAAPRSNQNASLFLVGESDYDDREKILISMAAPGDWGKNNLQFRIKYHDGLLRVGNGTTSSGYNTLGPVHADRGVWTVESLGQTIKLYRSNQLVATVDHNEGPAESSGFVVGAESKNKTGSFSGWFSEILIYPFQNNNSRTSIYNNLNAYWAVGPQGVNAGALLPQRWQYQVDLYDWLETVRLQDVQITPKPLVWDGSYSDTEELADLWLELGAGRGYVYLVPSRSTKGDAKWFVLDDGAGGGIEGSGEVKVYFQESASYWSLSNEPAYWYQRSIPLASGENGNPYYADPAVARRALVLAAVDLIMLDEEHDKSVWLRRNDYAGAGLLSWAYAFSKCQDILDAKTKEAFEAGFSRMLTKFLLWGAHDVNTNMDTRTIAAAAYIYRSTTDAGLKDLSTRVARRILFGSENGTLETVDSDIGIFYPAGYVGEADSPETTYNGVSLYHIVDAYVTTLGEGEWSFLEEVVRRMIDFKLNQYFVDPGDGRGGRYYEGPAGYAGRTAGSYVYDQRARIWRDISAAALFPEARPLVHETRARNRDVLLNTIDMVEGIRGGIDYMNKKGFGDLDTTEPPVWSGGQPWPMDHPYHPPSGWYGKLKALVDANDPSTYVPYERENTINRSFDDEFWSYKNSDGSQDFGFLVESMTDGGHYTGWYGGKLEAFWTRDAGILVLNRHNKSGDEKDQDENTRVWSEIDTWAVDHVWGKGESGTTAFSSATQRRDPVHLVNYSLAEPDPYVEVVTTLARQSQQTGGELLGSVAVSKTYRALPHGIEVDIRLTSDEADRVTELWASIPVFLRHADRQSELSDTQIEYWNGSQWRPLGTTLVETSKMRLGRDFRDGRGTQYGYIEFASVQRVKLASSVWMQSYQASNLGGVRIRNIHIDLLGSGGVAVQLPALVSVQYAITTQDPGGNMETTQSINLQKGWNTIALCVVPDILAVETLLSKVLSNVVLVRNGGGDIFYPEYGINDIGDWNTVEAYEVNVSAPVTFDVNGVPIDAESTTIPLRLGWNLIPFVPEIEMPVEEALAPIADHLVLVIDNLGQVYYPEYGINAIGSMKPGQGYSLYVNAATTLQYPYTQRSQGEMRKGLTTSTSSSFLPRAQQ